MDSRWIAALIAASAVALGVLWVAGSRPTPDPSRGNPPAPAVATPPMATPIAPAIAPATAPATAPQVPTSNAAPDHPRRSAIEPGSTDDPLGRPVIRPIPALGGGDKWRDLRQEREVQLAATQVEVARGFAEERGLKAPETEELTRLIAAHFASLAALRTQVEDGSMRPADMRQGALDVRTHTESALTALLGQEAQLALREELLKTPAGGF